MNKIGLKRQKRKRKIKARLKCHGSKEACQLHFRIRTPRQIIKKHRWWEKLLAWFKKLLK